MKQWVLAGALLALGTAAAAAQELVIIESTVPGLAAGAQLAAGKAVTVPDKAKLVVLAASGQMLTLTGPYQGVPGAGASGGDSRVMTAIASLVRSGQRESGSVGAVRVADVPWRRETARSLDDVLALDATGGGDTCLFDPAKAQIVRKPQTVVGAVTVHAMDSGQSAAVAFPPGAVRVPWPATLPIEDGDNFVFEEVGQPTAATVTVRLLPGDKAGNDLERVAMLAEAGCEDQARLLLGLMATAAK